MSKFGFGDKPKNYKAEQPGAYPTSYEAHDARNAGFAYGTPWENYFNNELAVVLGKQDYVRHDGQTVKTVKPGSATGLNVSKVTSAPAALVELAKPENEEVRKQVSDVFAKAALASNRNSIASLGFSPSNTILDIASNKTNIGGLYSPSVDKIWANLAGDVTGSSVVHESIHRGIEQLRKVPEAKKLLDQLPNEEYVVRYIMYKTMGNTETGEGDIGDKQIEMAKHFFEAHPLSKTYNNALSELQDIAANRIKDLKPMGPR